MIWLFWILCLLVSAWAFARLVLTGDDLSRFDEPARDPQNDAPSAENADVLERVQAFARAARSSTGRQRLTIMRQALDAMGENADLDGIDIRPVTVAGRPAEWLVHGSGEVAGRLLYLHGGAFTMGSPLSHRVVTTELARRTGLAVLAVDYRLMPEHPRRAGIEDSRAAYRWILDNGPDGPAPAGVVFVAGDSAGGNLALSLIAWLRDGQRRGSGAPRQVDGAMALSPLTDATLSSPSMTRNIDHDPMLGPMVRLIRRVPHALMLWSTWLQNRIRPSDPLLSPVRGELSGLPPVLVQASEAEVLIDDARRYANKARASGSPVEIETWRGMVHVWQAFGPELPEADQAYARMADFVRRVLEARSRANAA